MVSIMLGKEDIQSTEVPHCVSFYITMLLPVMWRHVVRQKFSEVLDENTAFRIEKKAK
jgi:hypothetical protein